VLQWDCTIKKFKLIPHHSRLNGQHIEKAYVITWRERESSLCPVISFTSPETSNLKPEMAIFMNCKWWRDEWILETIQPSNLSLELEEGHTPYCTICLINNWPPKNWNPEADSWYHGKRIFTLSELTFLSDGIFKFKPRMRIAIQESEYISVDIYICHWSYQLTLVILHLAVTMLSTTEIMHKINGVNSRKTLY
jgi:hypothetical protein